MPAYLGEDDYFGAKVITAVPGNQGTEYPSHLGSVMLFDSKYGALRAMVDATTVTEIRTGAVSGVATELLARKDSDHPRSDRGRSSGTLRISKLCSSSEI